MRLRSLRTSALSILFALPVVACDPPPAANPDDATPAAEAPAADAPTADADAAAEAPADDAAAKAPEVDQSNLPEAEALFAANVKAIGGKDKIDTIKTYYTESEMEIPAQKIKITNKMWWKGGDFYAEAEMPGMGVTKVWKVGEELWSEDPINGMRKVEGKEAEQQMRSNALVLTAEWKEYFASAKTSGRRSLDGKMVIDVLLTTESGDEVTMTFDESSSLLVEQSYMQDSPQGKIPMTMRVDAYEDYDGFKSVTKSTIDMTVAKIVSTVTKFELNAKIEKDKIKLPANAKK